MSDILILENENLETIGWNTELLAKKSFIERLNDQLVSSQSIKTNEKVVIFRLLATMVDAWLTLMKAISILENQEKNLVVKNVLAKFSEELKTWKSLSYCMGLFP